MIFIYIIAAIRPDSRTKLFECKLVTNEHRSKTVQHYNMQYAPC